MTAGWGGPASDSGRISFTAAASTRPEPGPPTRYRTGRKNQRTIYVQVGAEPSYEHDVQVGTMDTPELGRLVVEVLNAATPEGAHLLLTAFLTSAPLNFGQARVPADVTVRLDAAYADGTLKGVTS